VFLGQSDINMNQLKFHQKGAATLIVTSVLLLAVTIISLYSSQIIVTEQRISGNDFRSRQAFEAGQAGSEAAISNTAINPSTLENADQDTLIDTNTNIDLVSMAGPGDKLTNNSNYSATYSNPYEDNFKIVAVSAQGFSDDSSSIRRSSFLMVFNSLQLNIPDNPLTATGEPDPGGSFAINNTEDPLNTISSGGDCTGCESYTNGGVDGVDDNNEPLAALSGSDFFETYFDATMAEVKAMATVITDTGPSCGNAIDGLQGQIIWLEPGVGNECKLNATVVVGTSTNPVIIIAEDDLTINGGATINGLLYKVGGWENGGAGGANINGGVLVDGDFDTTGNGTIEYDSTILEILSNDLSSNIKVKVAGSWNDF
jgi:Tfp pilus assembly protein PilX